MAVDWTQLPGELLESISNNLTIYADYLRFRSVCHCWRSSVPKTPRHLPPQLPWLMLPHTRSQSQSHRAFFDVSAQKIRLLKYPESSHRKRCCGSSHGWLLIMDETPAVLLINPLTRVKVQLPPLSTFPIVLSFNYSEIGKEYALTTPSGDIYRCSLREMRDSFIKKVILSMSPAGDNNFIALAILNLTGDLAFCKNGDESWTFIHDAKFFSEDVIYHKELFYAVDKNGSIAVCDVSGTSPRVSIIKTPSQFGGDIQYLANSEDDEELLLVTRYLDLVNDNVDLNVFFKTVKFEVFRINWNGPLWERLTSLGDRTLFVGGNSSLSLSTSDFPACSGNCIYFTDDYCEFNEEFAFGDYDLGIFKLCDGSIEPLPCYRRSSHSQIHGPPIWVTPNP
ncbi:F-box protein SKIP23-like [Juglans microcarpa x Juglans regia]|uniref:F-box protein SKIP23-like n=1 Tax=Juglans microcarpa x Juglans regia TaxID=2249226 RepID=UPI001B7DFF55|nr:F-box protein SKIP23-like [Juglans microcarpa x Juglans regia]